MAIRRGQSLWLGRGVGTGSGFLSTDGADGPVPYCSTCWQWTVADGDGTDGESDSYTYSGSLLQTVMSVSVFCCFPAAGLPLFLGCTPPTPHPRAQ